MLEKSKETLLAEEKNSVAQIIEDYKLQKHEEGGYFSEVYTASAEVGAVDSNRPLAGSIYFLLPPKEISHFHVIDCEEIWYYHSGCGLKVYLITPAGGYSIVKLGLNIKAGESPMVVIPKGTIFAAENIAEQGYTFVSCATVPKFSYAGFRLVAYEEIKKYGAEERLCIS